MRIIAGTARGRKLTVLPGWRIRPTADRVKEAIFSVLAQRVAGAVVLDAFAGSAALGLEALSRGAETVWFIESDRRAAEVCEKNIALLQPERCRLLRGDCLKLLPHLAESGEALRFDLIFADPPYNRGLLNPLMKLLADLGALAPGGVLIAETTAKASEFLPDSRWAVVKSATYGDTAIYYCQLK